MIKNNFKNADEAFKYFYREIIKSGVAFGDTKALFNVGFTIENPINNDMYITNGAFVINSHGWLITRESWSKEETTEVRLEESDCKTEENGKNYQY